MECNKQDELIDNLNSLQTVFNITSRIDVSSRNFVFIGSYHKKNEKNQNVPSNNVNMESMSNYCDISKEDNGNQNIFKSIKQKENNTQNNNNNINKINNDIEIQNQLDKQNENKNQNLNLISESNIDDKKTFAIKLLPFYNKSHEDLFLNEENSLKLFEDSDPVIKYEKIVEIYMENKKYLLVAMKYYKSGDLFSYLFNRIDYNTNFVDPITLCLASYNAINLLILHKKRKIVHNDFKFENIIVTSENPSLKVSMTDYENSEHIDNNKLSQMVGGTTIFNAPEAIIGKPHSYSADMWSLGVNIYFFAYNCLPFNIDENDNEQTIIEKIINVKLEMPKYGPNARKEIWECISKMLELRPSKRIKPEEAIKLSWFKFIDVEKRENNSIIY